MPLWLYLTALVLLVAFGLLVSAGLLWATAKLLKARLSFWMACASAGIVMSLSIASVLTARSPVPVLGVILALAIPVTIVVVVHRWGEVGWWRAIFISIVFGLGANAVAIPQVWALRSTISDSYVPTTNSMAPTIVVGDRFVADRTLTARRWDVIVYRSPVDGRTAYVKRLVGLPGETIEIIDGHVHVNGSPAAPPVALGWLRYQSPPYPRGGPLRGVAGSPITLGPDEFFVLGDNSIGSEDSRHTPAVPGYQPGAVPRSYLVGVVRLVYWPWPRVRTFR